MQTTSVNTERMASRAAVIANVRGLRELKERNRLEAEEQERCPSPTPNPNQSYLNIFFFCLHVKINAYIADLEAYP